VCQERTARDDGHYRAAEAGAPWCGRRFLDFPVKNKGGARCSDTWEYSAGTPAALEVQEETGDCGEPSVADTETYELLDIKTAEDIPSTFEPEQVCPLPLIDPFIDACKNAKSDGVTSAADACCEIVDKVFRPSSGAAFGSCLCVPSFYNAVDAKVSAFGGNLKAVLDLGVQEARGLPACWLVRDAQLPVMCAHQMCVYVYVTGGCRMSQFHHRDSLFVTMMGSI
jgi:hypothetical protein